jgi:glucans biosynthesis protein
MRVIFDMDAGADAWSELRLVLESQGKPISETWLYRWTP